jgi:hypothetical protein
MNTRSVRCISLWQPWASLMACGAKFIETRHWPTSVRGAVCIHASKTTQGIVECLEIDPDHMAAMEKALGLPIHQWEKKLPLGQIIAEGSLTGCLDSQIALTRHPDQAPFGNFAPGRYGHVYQNLRPIGPFHYRGAQGFFNATIPTP